MDNYQEKLQSIFNNVEKVIIGKRGVIELIIMALVCDGHVLIEDVPGVGKTGLVSAIAKSFDASFKRIQFTSDVMPSDITGFSIFNQKSMEFEYRNGAIMSQFILADEINRTSPKTQASLLEAMEESQVTVDGTTYELPKPFMVLATQNPIDFVGTFPLPEAQIDRFFMKITVGYPLRDEEQQILSSYQLSNPIDSLQPVSNSNDIINMQEQVKKIHVDESIKSYIVEIANRTRNNQSLLLGASIRGSLSLFRAAQASAFFADREYVIPDDVIKMAQPTLSHRLILRQEAKLNKISQADVLSDIISSIRVPIL